MQKNEQKFIKVEKTRLSVDFGLHDHAVSSSTGVEIRPVFVPHLTARLATSVLSALDESSVPICANDSVVEARAVDVGHGVFGVVALIIFDEAESARRPLELVQTHDDALDVAAFAEQLVELLLCRVEGHVAHVERGRLPKKPLLFASRAFEVLIAIRTQIHHRRHFGLVYKLAQLFGIVLITQPFVYNWARSSRRT